MKKSTKKFLKIILLCWVIAPVGFIFLSKVLPKPSDELMMSAPHTPALFVSAEMAKKMQ